MSDVSDPDRTESAQKRRKFLADLGGEGRRRPVLARLAGAAAVTAAVGSAMVAGSGVASAAGCTPEGSPIPEAQSQTYDCGGYIDHYEFQSEDPDGHCFTFNWWWDIIACAGGPQMNGPLTVCD